MQLTKPGRHGTLHLYSVKYSCKLDPGFPPSAWSTWAYNREHAEDRFQESCEASDDLDWEVLSVERVKAAA
jgi:hypothetical protein